MLLSFLYCCIESHFFGHWPMGKMFLPVTYYYYYYFCIIIKFYLFSFPLSVSVSLWYFFLLFYPRSVFTFFQLQFRVAWFQFVNCKEKMVEEEKINIKYAIVVNKGNLEKADFKLSKCLCYWEYIYRIFFMIICRWLWRYLLKNILKLIY